jgi:hypothetical protein
MRRRRPDATSSKEPQCSQARRAPFIHAEVEAGATQRRFDAQRKTGGGGRPVLMASQQMERAAELHLVRAEVVHRGCGQARRPYGWLCKHAGRARTGAVRSKRVSSCASRRVWPAML